MLKLINTAFVLLNEARIQNLWTVELDVIKKGESKYSRLEL